MSPLSVAVAHMTRTNKKRKQVAPVVVEPQTHWMYVFVNLMDVERSDDYPDDFPSQAAINLDIMAVGDYFDVGQSNHTMVGQQVDPHNGRMDAYVLFGFHLMGPRVPDDDVHITLDHVERVAAAFTPSIGGPVGMQQLSVYRETPRGGGGDDMASAVETLQHIIQHMNCTASDGESILPIRAPRVPDWR